jgi:hypothetical protein
MSWTKRRIGADSLFDDTMLPLHKKLAREGGNYFRWVPIRHWTHTISRAARRV